MPHQVRHLGLMPQVIPWLVQLPLIGLAGALVLRGLPRFATLSEPTREQEAVLKSLILSSRVDAFFQKPSDVEFFLCIVILIPLMAWLGAWIGKRLSTSTLDWWWAYPAVLLSQLSLVAFILSNFIYEWVNPNGHAYFNRWALLRIAAVALVLSLCLRHRSRFAFAHKLPRGVAPALAALFAVWGLLPSIATDRSLGVLLGENAWHLGFFMDEFAAALNGKVLRFDYIPQYTTLLPYAAVPYFRMAGFSVLSFTALMAVLSALGLCCVYRIFRSICATEWQALLLFLAFLGISFFGARDYGADLSYQKYYVFSYYAQSPFRLLAVWVIGLLLVRSLESPSMSRVAALGAVSALSAVNNLDYGFSAGVAAAVALGFTLSRDQVRAKLAIFFLSGLPVPVLAWAMGVWASGRAPELRDAFVFEQAGSMGFLSRSLLPHGFYWILIASFASAIATSFAALAGRDADGNARLENGVLLFSGLMGLFGLARYISRSDWEVLQFSFPLWAMPVLVLFRSYFFSNRESEHESDRRLERIPRVMLLVAVSSYLMLFPSLPNVPGQFKRWTAEVRPEMPTEQELAAVIRSKVPAGEKVLIIHSNGQWIARLAGVDNVFPYAQGFCVMLKRQLEVIREILDRDRVEWVFVEDQLETETLLESKGFRLESTVFRRFRAWKRDPRS